MSGLHPALTQVHHYRSDPGENSTFSLHCAIASINNVFFLHFCVKGQLDNE